LVSSFNVDLESVGCVFRVGREVVSFGQFPVEGGKGRFLHWVADHGAVFKKDESVRGGQCECGLLFGLGHLDELSGIARAGCQRDREITSSLYSLDTSDTFHNQIFTGNRTRLVETADIDSTSEWDSERLGTEDCYLLA
jgi:hypothetical protein